MRLLYPTGAKPERETTHRASSLTTPKTPATTLEQAATPVKT